MDEVSQQTAFTTHTPVAAGHDYFAPDMLVNHLRPLQRRLGLSDYALLALGRVEPHNDAEEFCMTTLALKLSHRANAVSSLHGITSRRMWQSLWPGRRSGDVPIGHVTNGVHVDTWLADELAEIYADCLGADWHQRLRDARHVQAFEGLDEFQLWNVKVALKQRLLRFVERRSKTQRERIGMPDPMRKLRPDVLTIGFARRFAVYKRAGLLFQDLDRARRLLTDPQRPVQVILAGKAHPADEPGKAILRRLAEISRMPEFRDHVVLLEDHDKNVGAHLIEGADLWLNCAAPAARGLRHERHEGGVQRHTQLLDPGWLVGRSLRHPQRLRLRRRVRAQRRAVAGRARCQVAHGRPRATRSFRCSMTEMASTSRWAGYAWSSTRCAPWAGATTPTAW